MMKMLKTFSTLLALALVPLLAFAATAQAASPVGVWRSTSGNTFIVPPFDASPFVMVLVAPNGTRELYTGRWTAGLEGTQFTYAKPNSQGLTATFDSRNANTVKVVGGGTNTTWTKSGTLTQTSVSGTWRSSSGNRFVVLPPVSEGATFDIVMTRANGERELYPARWTPGLEGTQFGYGSKFATIATLDVRSMSSVRVLANSEVTTWTREGRAPSRALVFGSDLEAPAVVAVVRGERRRMVCAPGLTRTSDLELGFGDLLWSCSFERSGSAND